MKRYRTSRKLRVAGSWLRVGIILTFCFVISCSTATTFDARTAVYPGTVLRDAAGGDQPGRCMLPVGAKIRIERRVLVYAAAERARTDWVYVNQISCDPAIESCPPEENRPDVDCTGWMRAEDAASSVRFQQLRGLSMVVGELIGDSDALPETSFTINPDGTYIYYCYPCKNCDPERVCPHMSQIDPEGNFYVTGRIYRYGNLLWAKEADRFLFRRAGEICPLSGSEYGHFRSQQDFPCVPEPTK